MTKEEAAEVYPVLKDYAEGQDVEIFCKVADKPQSYWHTTSEVRVRIDEGWNFPYRVKPRSEVKNLGGQKMDTSKILGIALELNELNESIETLKSIVERNKDIYLKVSDGTSENTIDYEEYPYIKEEINTIFSKVLNERLERRESLKKDMLNSNLWQD